MCTQEKQQRGTVLPVLKQTIQQLDGTLDPKHKLSAAGKRSPEENISAFGHAFYTVSALAIDAGRVAAQLFPGRLD